MKRYGISFALMIASLLLVKVHAQCSSLYTTPEFPVATHPADGHTQSWGCNLFTPTQFGTAAATITGIQIYVDNSFGATNYASQTIWLRHTVVANYPNATYPTTAGFTQCFSGSYSFPMSGLYTVNFNVSSFAYNGVNNVEILFENRSGTYRANEPWFRRTPSYGAGVYRSKWNGNFGFGGFPGTASDGSAVRLTYTLSLSASGAGGCGNILPMNLLRFVGEYRGTEAYLEWESGGEKTNGSYELERSIDGSSFEKITVAAFLLPLEESHVYHFADADPGAEQTFYRLVRLDVDGTREYSEVIVLRRNPLLDRSLQVWPNPARDMVEVALPAQAEPGDCITLLAPDGREVASMADLGDQQTCELPMLGLPAGIYMVRYLSKGQVWASKVVHH